MHQGLGLFPMAGPDSDFIVFEAPWYTVRNAFGVFFCEDTWPLNYEDTLQSDGWEIVIKGRPGGLVRVYQTRLEARG